MKLPRFDYARPKTLREAIELLGATDGAKLLAGGQSLIPIMAYRLAAPPLLIDINRLEGLAYIHEADGWLKIGAMTREVDLERSSLVHERFATAVAFERAVGSEWIVRVIMATALLSLMKIFNGNFVAASRLLFGMGRRGFADPRLGFVDRVFTRIGASDNLARGRSTFMVEMTETAAILHTATARSLILLDEVGRGTATYDGLAIAWAAVEYIHARMRAKTLFATHYFELTELAERLSGVKNYHVSVKETGGGIVFLLKVEPGAADRSYGIEVAKLAGLPNEVIERAREVLAEHESAEQRVTEQLASDESRPRPAAQLTIFTPLSQPVLERLREVDLNHLTPLEALNLLAELKKQIE